LKKVTVFKNNLAHFERESKMSRGAKHNGQIAFRINVDLNVKDLVVGKKENKQT